MKPHRWLGGGKSMLCRKCSAENPQDAKFCIRCGTSFQRRCEKCGYQNPPDARFCAQCGAPLDAAPAEAPVTERIQPLPLTRGRLGGGSPEAEAQPRANGGLTG